jgi:hypothetical protein
MSEGREAEGKENMVKKQMSQKAIVGTQRRRCHNR